MPIDTRLRRFVNILVFSKTIPILLYILYPGIVGVGAFVDTILTLYAFVGLKRNHRTKSNCPFSIRLWLFAIALGFFQSLFTSNVESDFATFVLSLLSLLSIFFIFIVYDLKLISFFMKAFLRYFIPLGLFSSFFWDNFLIYDTPHIMSHLALFAIVLFFFPRKYQFYIAGALVYALIIDSSVRACLLTTLVVMSFAICYKIFTNHIFSKIVKLAHLSFYILPLLFIFLGFSGIVNVFEAMENSNTEVSLGGKKGGAGRSSNVDSRTAIYTDVAMNIDNLKTLVIGNGPTYKIKVFTTFGMGSDQYNEGRGSVEVGILNILMFYGMFGCLAFFFLCFYASSNSMKSNNSFIKLIGVFVAYKFMFSFIEDPAINVTTYLAIGICLNGEIRRMSDKDIKKRFLAVLA